MCSQPEEGESVLARIVSAVDLSRMHSTEIWKNFVDALPDAAVGLSEGEVKFINEPAALLFGVDAGSCPSAQQLFPDEDERARLHSSPAGHPLELHCNRMGLSFLADVRCRAVDDSEPRLLLCIVREVQMSQEAQKRHRAAVDLLDLGLFDHDQVADVIWGSPGHRALYGVTPTEPLTIPRLLQGLHPEDFSLVAPAIEQAHDPAGNGIFDVEHRVIWPTGEIRWVRTRSKTEFAVIDEKPRAVRTVGVSTDQTARKELERDRERIVNVLEESPDFVSIAAPDGSLLYLNRSARALFNISQQEDISERKLADQHTSSSQEVLMKTALPGAQRDRVWSGNATLVGASGKKVPVSLVVIAHFKADDTLERYATIARDLSREKELEEQLLQSQKMEALGRLAGGAAHDFNNLLTVIINSTELAMARLSDENPVRSELAVVIEASNRATDLTRQMLTFSRKSASDSVVVDMNDVITRMMHILSRLIGKNVELRVGLAHEPGKIKMDPSQVEQVILNLVVNARDAMPKGGTLTVETRTVVVDEDQRSSLIRMKPGSHVVLHVSDSGIGMNATTKAQIFEPFFTTKKLGEGTGLGLSTVFGIVQQGGGSIHVDSEVGQGTRFEISFPRADLPGTSETTPSAKGHVRTKYKGLSSALG